MFGYLILIRIDFSGFISLFSPWCYLRLRRYIKPSRQCLTTFPNTSNFRIYLRCMEMWSTTAFCVWYITWNATSLNGWLDFSVAQGCLFFTCKTMDICAFLGEQGYLVKFLCPWPLRTPVLSRYSRTLNIAWSLLFYFFLMIVLLSFRADSNIFPLR